MALVCRHCYRELLEDEMPDDPRKKLVCPQCKSAGQFIAVADEPIKKWELNHNDRQLLKSFRIATEDPEEK